MGALDLLKSERGIMNLVFLGVLAVLLFTHAGKDAVDTWALYAGSVTAIYTTAKSLKPNDTPKAAPEPAKPDPNGEILS